MTEGSTRKSLRACNLCNIALFQEVEERVKGGEKVNAICKDLEDFQRQLYGAEGVTVSANAMVQRYRTMKGLKSNKKNVVATEIMDEIVEMATDPEVVAKVQAYIDAPPEKPEPVVEAVPVVKTASDFAEDVRRGLTQLNAIVTQRGHGFTDGEREGIRIALSLIFRNIGE